MTSDYCSNQMVQTQNFLALEAITNPSKGTPRFKSRKPLRYSVIAKIATPFIVLMLLLAYFFIVCNDIRLLFKSDGTNAKFFGI